MCRFSLRSSLILLVFLLCFDGCGFAQDKKQLVQQADQFYQKQQYAEAMRLYSQLLSLHPRDPFYSYRFGVSMLYADKRDLNRALNYIKMGEDHLENDDRIMYYFHLATAYHYTFRFREAIENYQFFAQLTHGNKKYAALEVDRRIMMCRNGLKLLKELRDIYVIEKQHVGIGYFFRAYDMSQFHGRLLAKPDALKTKLDKKRGDQSLVFLSDTQQVIYFSSYGKDGSTGRDIYMARRTPSGWSAPERLPDIINSPYDEDYPYLAPDGKTLYFSSRGHSTMGGYDIFYSKWDDFRKEWTKPVNLDFPINTPYDDFLFVTDSKMEYAYFASDRGSAPNRLHVYLVRIDIRPVRTDGEQLVQLLEQPEHEEQYQQVVEQLQTMAMMEVNASREQFQKPEQPAINYRYADNHLYGLSDNPTESEIIQKSFERVSEAERQFLMLRQKREAMELLASRYAYQSQQYQQQARQILQQTEKERNQQQKQQLQQQYAASEQVATAYKQRAEQIQQAANQLQQTIIAQEQVFRRMQMYAGDIQRLASAQKIDTSVALFKQLVRDSRIFDAQISIASITYFPTQEDEIRFESELTNLRQTISTTEQQISFISQQLAQADLSNEQKTDRTADASSSRHTLQNTLAQMNEFLQQLKQQEEQMRKAHLTARSENYHTDLIIMNEYKEAQETIRHHSDREAFLHKPINESQSIQTLQTTDQFTHDQRAGQEDNQIQQMLAEEQKSMIQNQLQQNLQAQTKHPAEVQNDTRENAQENTETAQSLIDNAFQEYKNKNVYQRQAYVRQLLEQSDDVATGLEILKVIAQWEQGQILTQEAFMQMLINRNVRRLEHHREKLEEIAQSLQIGNISSSELLMQQILWEIELEEYRRASQNLSVLSGMQSALHEEYEKTYEGWQAILHLISQAEQLQKSGEQKKTTRVIQQIARHINNNQNLWNAPAIDDAPELYVQNLAKNIERHQELLRQKQQELQNTENQLAIIEVKLFQTNKPKQANRLAGKYEQLKLQQEQLRNEIHQIEQGITARRHEVEYTNNFANILADEMSSVQLPVERLSMVAEQFRSSAFQSQKDTDQKPDPFSTRFKHQLMESFGLSSDQFLSTGQLSRLLFVPEIIEVSSSDQQMTSMLREVQRGYEYNIQATAMLFLRKIQFIDHQLERTTDSTERMILLQQRQYIRNELAPFLEDSNFLQKLVQQETLPDPRELDRNIILMAQWISILEAQKNQIASDTTMSFTQRMQQLRHLNDSITIYRKKLEFLAYHRQLYQLQLEVLVMQHLFDDNQLSVTGRQALRDTFVVLQQNLSSLLVFPDDVQKNPMDEHQLRSRQQQLDNISNRSGSIYRDLESDAKLVEKKASALVLVRKFTDVQQTIERKEVVMLSDDGQRAKEQQLISTSQQTQVSQQRQPVVGGMEEQQSQSLQFGMQVLSGEQRSRTERFVQSDLSSGIIYRVQFIALRRQADADRFIQMKPVYEEYTGGLYRYLHGDYTDYQKAVRSRDSIRAAGFSDAFIVAYRMGKRISLAEARQYDIEPFSQQAQVSQQVSFTTTEAGLPPGFYYMVQVGVFGRPRTSDQLFGIQPLYEERMENGYYRYYTGPFTTYEEAIRTQSRLRSTSVPDAFIVAFREGRRISVAEARQATGAGAEMWVHKHNRRMSDEIVYAVQLGAFEKEQTTEVRNIFGQVCDNIQMLKEDNKVIYYCGEYGTYEDARKMKDTLLNAGFSDVFVIALKNQQRIPLQEALQNR